MIKKKVTERSGYVSVLRVWVLLLASHHVADNHCFQFNEESINLLSLLTYFWSVHQHHTMGVLYLSPVTSSNYNISCLEIPI